MGFGLMHFLAHHKVLTTDRKPNSPNVRPNVSNFQTVVNFMKFHLSNTRLKCTRMTHFSDFGPISMTENNIKMKTQIL